MEKKYIIILAEEYWHDIESKNYKFINAKYLLNKIKNENRYDIKILKFPGELLSSIDRLGKSNIKAIFIFQDIFSDSFLNKISIIDMKNKIKSLRDDYGVHIYPGIDVTDRFASKKYYLDLIEDMNYSALPGSKVYKILYQKNSDNQKINDDLYKISGEMLQNHEKIVIKKGYSYSGVQVRTFNKENYDDKKRFYEKLEQLNYKKFFEVGTNATIWEKGIERYYILQGFNKVIKNRLHEYRVFFFNGKAKYIAWGDDLPNLCTEDYEEKSSNVYSIEDSNNDSDYEVLNKDSFNMGKLNRLNPDLGVEVLRFAKKVYNDYLKIFWKNEIVEHPIIFRIDVSYALDKEFIDEHAINIKGFEGKVRLYVNELEVDPTHYFYNNLVCKKNKDINTKYVQELTGRLINEYISKI